jgi:hypothetical protein
VGDGVSYEKGYVWGIMLAPNAIRVTSAFNMLSDKISMVVDAVKGVPRGRHPYSIPVTFNRFDCGALTQLTRATAWQGEKDMKFELENFGLASELKRLSVVVFIDPRPGRSARGRNGLYDDILKALEWKGQVR